MATKKESAAEAKQELAEALAVPGAVLSQDAISASKQRVQALHNELVAAGAVNGTSAAAPSTSTPVAPSTPSA